MCDHKKTNHWRSLDEHENSPAFQEGLKDEFVNGIPPQADETEATKAPVERRDFLKLMGFGAAAVMTACSRMPVEKAIPYLSQPEDIVPGKAYWYASTCMGCSASCGLLVKNREGRPIKVEGNPGSPLSRGGLCSLGQSGVLELYDSGRLQGPREKLVKTTWAKLDANLQSSLAEIKTAGGRVVVLSDTVTSPTLQASIDQFLAGFTDASHVSYDAVSSSAILEAHEASFSKAIIPHYNFENAKVIVSFGADFLGTWISPVEFAKQFSKTRDLTKPNDMSQLIQFESRMSLTGSNADLRYPIKSGETGGLLMALFNELSGRGDSFKLANHEDKIKSVAQKLRKNRGKSLIISDSNDEDVQKLIVRMNMMLGNYGKTLMVNQGSKQKQGRDAQMDQLLTQMKQGKVAALVIMGANPVYNHPKAEEFATALKKVKLSVSLTPRLDETSSLVSYNAPDSHFLESWGDVEPVEGVFHLSQPVIRTVYNTRQQGERLLPWAGSKEDYREFLKSEWNKKQFTTQTKFLVFGSFWKQMIHDGVYQSPASTAPELTFNQSATIYGGNLAKSYKQAVAQKGFELSLYEKVAIRDGRAANNPWLQEMPDPISKITWDNYANISIKDGKKLGLKDGDIVRISHGNQVFQLPVHNQPGQAQGTVSVALGYGRTKSGKVGDGVGVNAYPFVLETKGVRRYTALSADLKKMAEHVELAKTQTHYSLEGRPLFKETTLDKFKKDPASGNKNHVDLVMLWDQHKNEGHSWGLTLDTNACIGCSGCLVGCQSENNVPVVGREEVKNRREMHWIRLDRYYQGDVDNPDVAFQPMMCQHCGNAPCESVCPVLATVHSSDGLNQQVYNRCVGTRYCANNCPYKVRRFNWFDYASNAEFNYYMNDSSGKLVLNPDIVVRSRGVMEKCSMCVQRIQEQKLLAKQAGLALNSDDIKPACQQSCPSDAIVFGDLNNPKSKISKILKDNKRRYNVLGELNVKPALNYLTKVRNKG